MKTNIRDFLKANPRFTTRKAAQELAISELEVVKAVTGEMATFLEIDTLETVLSKLPELGKFTTIIQVGELIFEIMDVFPKGKNGHGYYNIGDPKSHLHGHLKLNSISEFALVEKPRMGSMSYCIQFFDSKGDSLFKIFLGRDQQRNIWPQQLEYFNQLKASQSALV